eukprot:GEMP01055939.1.p1 GENE.GEMP01055939.1~~GEMP01055939.1.p1  ORF type:complete len:271 (+),score=54.08 GEMP01055939.1:55-813(+)
MDLGAFSDKVLELLNDDFLESHEQARVFVSQIDDDAEDVACVFGVDPLAYRLFSSGITEDKSDLALSARFDHISIGNKILERINEILHWQRNVSDILERHPDETELDDEEDAELPDARKTGLQYLEKKLPDIPKSLVEEVEREVFDEHGHEKHQYRARLRAITINCARNDQLLMDFVRGAIPARWLAAMPERAFATKEQKRADAKIRKEARKDVQLDPESAAIFEKAKRWARPDEDEANPLPKNDNDASEAG